MEKYEGDILLIEDNPDEAELAIRSLRMNSVVNNIIHIDDGAEALDFIFSRRKYSDKKNTDHLKLILLDLNLSKVDGIEILRQLKSNEQTKMIPVVVLTASREERDMINSYKIGVNSYIVKPVNFESFLSTMAEVKKYWLVLNQTPRLVE